MSMGEGMGERTVQVTPGMQWNAKPEGPRGAGADRRISIDAPRALAEPGERRRRVLVGIALLLLLATAALLQTRVDGARRGLPSVDGVLYLPSGAYLRQIALGYDQAWADLLWLRTIGYYADQANTERRFTYLYRMLDVITTLDPKFLYPYLFGGVTLSIELGRPDLANRILLKGMRHHPGVWKIPFLIGFNAYFGQGNAGMAARYIGHAARLPGSPQYLSAFAARLYIKGSGREKALAFLSEVIRQTEDPELRRRLIQRHHDIRTGVVKGPVEVPSPAGRRR
jgi:hypothetical protein